MSVFLALVAVAAVSWMFRVSFTAVMSEEQLPNAIRSRMDVIGPATFAALLAADLSDTSTGAALPTIAAMAAAVVVAWRTRNHGKAVLAAGAAWYLISIL